MKITAYMDLLPQHIDFDMVDSSVRLTDTARDWYMDVYPSTEEAGKALRGDGGSTYTVTADLPDGSVFEVRGNTDQTEGRGGLYLAGLFDNYPAAFAAAAGLGVMGRRGDISVRPAPENVFSSVQQWKDGFDRDNARKVASTGRFNLRRVVQLATDDGQAVGTANPEYAIWLQLNKKYAPKTGATA